MTERQYRKLRLIYAGPKVPETLKMKPTSQILPSFGVKCDRLLNNLTNSNFCYLSPKITNMDPPYDLTAHT
jgi:hypothetical protein